MGLSFKKAENLLSKLDINKLKKEANEKKIIIHKNMFVKIMRGILCLKHEIK